ncbi:hypothetical protein [Streptomyces sp. NPDC056600]|uniref:hypothetical protein n=1 Tax=Streptomyces sp. NPDC056600 TaxID=3345874 RepID=UPI0036901A87
MRVLSAIGIGVAGAFCREIADCYKSSERCEWTEEDVRSLAVRAVPRMLVGGTVAGILCSTVPGLNSALFLLVGVVAVELVQKAHIWALPLVTKAMRSAATGMG